MADDLNNPTNPAQPPAPPAPPADDEPKGSVVDPALHRKVKGELKDVKAELEKVRGEWNAAKQQLESFKAASGEVDNYKAWIEEQRDELVKGLPDEARKDLLDSVAGLSPLQQVRQIRALIKLSGFKDAPPKTPPAIDRSNPAAPDAAAPRTYAEWERLPRELRRKYDSKNLPD